MDFVRCRYFRQTLICRSGIRLNRALSPGVVKSLYLATNATPAALPLQLDENHTATFQTPSGQGVNCKSPLTKLALRELQRQWPEPLTFADLVARSKSEAAKEGHPADEASVENFWPEKLACMAVGVWNGSSRRHLYHRRREGPDPRPRWPAFRRARDTA